MKNIETIKMQLVVVVIKENIPFAEFTCSKFDVDVDVDVAKETESVVSKGCKDIEEDDDEVEEEE